MEFKKTENIYISTIQFLRTQTGLNCPDQPHIEPPSTPRLWAQEIHFRVGLNSQSLPEQCLRSSCLQFHLSHACSCLQTLLILTPIQGLMSLPGCGLSPSPRRCPVSKPGAVLGLPCSLPGAVTPLLPGPQGNPSPCCALASKVVTQILFNVNNEGTCQ